MVINSFKGRYSFLSNFADSPMKWHGVNYLNAEAAFQSAKLSDVSKRVEFSNLNPSYAKRKGRRVKLRNDWEEVKYSIMLSVVRAKFFQNRDLAEKLLSTENAILVEGNTWGDRTWGQVNGEGKNYLGEILMTVRDELRG